MGLFKEETYILEQIQRKQTQIYNDACDIGLLVEGDLKEEVKKSVASLKETFEFEREESKTPSSYTVTVTFRIPWEMDEGFIFGTEYRVTWMKLKKHQSMIKRTSANHNEYFSVETKNFQIKATSNSLLFTRR